MVQNRRTIRQCGKAALCLGIVVLLAAFGGVGETAAQVAGPSPVPLGTAEAFAVLGGQTVTNTGPSVVTGDLGVSPGSSIAGFPPGIVVGAIHATDTVAVQAQSDLTIAYNDAAGRASDSTISGDLGGLTLTPGVYTSASSLGLTGVLTLDGQGDEDAVFIFQVGSTLTTASASQVLLTGSAQACNVVWQVGSSATLGTNSLFSGNILALTSVTVTTGSVLNGRALARNGAVTLDTNAVSRAVCAAPVTTTTTAPGTTTTTPGATTTGPGGGVTTTTAIRVPTATTVPGAGTTPTTGPGSGTPTGPARPGLPRSGAEHSRGLAATGLALTGLGLALIAAQRRRVR